MMKQFIKVFHLRVGDSILKQFGAGTVVLLMGGQAGVGGRLVWSVCAPWAATACPRGGHPPLAGPWMSPGAVEIVWEGPARLCGCTGAAAGGGGVDDLCRVGGLRCLGPGLKGGEVRHIVIFSSLIQLSALLHKGWAGSVPACMAITIA